MRCLTHGPPFCRIGFSAEKYTAILHEKQAEYLHKMTTGNGQFSEEMTIPRRIARITGQRPSEKKNSPSIPGPTWEPVKGSWGQMSSSFGCAISVIRSASARASARQSPWEMATI